MYLIIVIQMSAFSFFNKTFLIADLLKYYVFLYNYTNQVEV